MLWLRMTMVPIDAVTLSPSKGYLRSAMTCLVIAVASLGDELSDAM